MKSWHPAWARCSAVWVLAVAASAGVFAQAASEPGQGRELAAELKRRFTVADVNQDGFLSRDEAKAGMPYVHRNFEQIDTAKTGSVSMAQVAAFFRTKAAARKTGG